MAYKNFKTLSDLNLKGKRIILRIDINSELINKKPTPSRRIKEHTKTINKLKIKKAKIIILAHQGRPKKKDCTSLKEHAKLLNKYTKIKFIEDTIGKKATKEINNLKNGEAILLENIRFIKDEYNPKKNNKITNFFKDKFDIYINDAFSLIHRDQTSLTALPKLKGKDKVIGEVLKKELENAIKIKSNINNATFILGGNKIKDIALLLNKKNILPTGILAILVLKAKGYNIGKKQTEKLKSELKFLPIVKRNLKNMTIPIDLAYDLNGKRKDISVANLPVNNALALDIGKKTIKLYKEKIKKSKKIFWKGTAGKTEKEGFEIGTKELLKAIENSKAYAVIAGGHSETSIEKFKINSKKLGYVSLSGGALVHYIAGKKLPGLEALKKRK